MDSLELYADAVRVKHNNFTEGTGLAVRHATQDHIGKPCYFPLYGKKTEGRINGVYASQGALRVIVAKVLKQGGTSEQLYHVDYTELSEIK